MPVGLQYGGSGDLWGSGGVILVVEMLYERLRDGCSGKRVLPAQRSVFCAVRGRGRLRLSE